MHDVVEESVEILHSRKVVLEDLTELKIAVVTAERQGVYCLEHGFKCIAHLVVILKISLSLKEDIRAVQYSHITSADR